MKLRVLLKAVLRYHLDLTVTPIMFAITIVGFNYFWRAAEARNDFALAFVAIAWAAGCLFVLSCWYSRWFDK